ncbi:uncharacterized protein K460DRAFT_290699 [Cucurbitaria berberidis CBS 394.84]|uniref:Deoxyribonuclease NucA/NucB domain-containing protein n=1 Tax=Cucurbitaria berberidis CBS 394.84 TaxID=1168544 RepID=A0A9P4L5Y9_9PLEO|nr:uncharacterized protein K460DRAFT_290699 [Cucurbitaria berberidis CBS 394.84]KAF1843215.1 hypothetical protein K460DRAFT_290699 [Cucurbitaria berberidis CBS 394.84]
MFYKRAPTDLGIFQVDCQNSESACNNACFYIRCLNPGPDANKITYTGAQNNEQNRRESGCRVNNPSAASVCRSFPFSQAFTDKLAVDQQCDEWPPALAQQQPFDPNPLVRPPNSLRCMPGPENGSLGGKLAAFLRRTNAARDDFFRVDFTTNIASADQRKVQYCLGAKPNCDQDGRQFGMVRKAVGGGKISSPYNFDKNDNRYSLLGTPYKELYQCSVKFTRDGDQDIRSITLSDWEDKDFFLTDFQLPNNGDTHLMQGLPKDLQIKRTGAFGSKIGFFYAPTQTPGQNINEFEWDSDMSGNGRGPATNDGQPDRFCRVANGNGPNKQDFECYFPCYRKANGR